MTTVGLDTSVMVAAVSVWHPSHERARLAVAGLYTARSRVVVPLHALIEAFSVLTRLPDERRLMPSVALAALRASFGAQTTVLTDVADTWVIFDRAAAAGVRGGAIHDFEILDAVAAAGATRLLTLDPEDFRRFGPRGVEIVEP